MFREPFTGLVLRLDRKLPAMTFFSRINWVVLDCLNGLLTPISRLPFAIGSHDGADLRLTGLSQHEHHCELLHTKEQGYALVKMNPEGEMVVNGLVVDFAPVKPEEDYSLKLGRHLFLVRGDKNPSQWRQRIATAGWLLYDTHANDQLGPLSLAELCSTALSQRRDGQCTVVPGGATVGFYLRQVLEVLEGQLQGAAELGAPLPDPSVVAVTPTARLVEPAPVPTLAPVTPPVAVAPTPSWSKLGVDRRTDVPIDVGRLTCPVCWLRFDEGDVMHIAVHESLRGDPDLGEEQMLRFHARVFNERRQALDPCGLVCTDIACPHCKRALPPGFVDNTHHILSIVGDHSAGKSYYLSVLVRTLSSTLFKHFNVRFQDADPSGNAPLNDMIKALFGAKTPAEARLCKTVLEGAMYERLPRQGRTVALPKPFVFFLESVATKPVRKDNRSTKEAESRCSVIFYDNAGEHFQPGRDSIDSPGAQHIASSAGIVFLFDPFNSPEFRQRIARLRPDDPQLSKPMQDQQHIILTETRFRIAKLLNLGLGGKIRTPLAIVVGKCDAWMDSALQGQILQNPVRNGRLNLEAVQHNSALTRELMMDIATTVVANAEGLSSHVAYFPVSSFGHTPVTVLVGNEDAVVPDPQRLCPLLVDIPALWILSQIEPGLVPTD